MALCCLALASFFALTYYAECSTKRDFLLISVATNETDGYLRFRRSTLVYGIESKILGMGQEWNGGNVKTDPGGGFKINLMKNELEKYKDRNNLVILFTDSYDVVLTAGEEEILKEFDTFDADVVFGAEDYCWPDTSLKPQYPKVVHGYKYLNSGGFIGYAPTLYKILTYKTVDDKDDDQLYYTEIFLDSTLRSNFNIKLDTQAKIFQNLNGNEVDVALEFLDDDTRISNTVYMTKPIVIHGNGPTKILLNSLGNYLSKAWTKKHGCISCDEGKINLDSRKLADYFVVTLAVFVEKPTPFLEEMLTRIIELNYPKIKVDLFIHNNVEVHESFVVKWVETQKEKKEYRSVKYISFSDNVKEWHARKFAM